MLELWTLGRISLERLSPDGRPNRLLGPGKPIALLTYLALSPQRTASREHLMDLLWADVDPKAARGNLRQTLYQLRRLLGDDAISGDGDRLSLAAPLIVDRDRFQAALEAGNVRAAVGFYGGPFFPAFAAPGGADFEQWADLERRRLHAAYARAMEELIRIALSEGRPNDAVRLARRLREADLDREAVRRLLVEALVAAGSLAEAGAEAQMLEGWLAERRRTPEPATTAVLRAARSAPRSEQTSQSQMAAEMVGRSREFSELLEAWERTRSGPWQHVHVTGAPGIGKTRLVSEVAARLESLGTTVVALRAHSGARNVSYSLAGDIARALATHPGALAVSPASADILVGLDPTLSGVFATARPREHSEDELPRLRSLALSDLAGAVAEEQPLALLVDDIQWADAASIRILNALRERPHPGRQMLVTTERAGYASLDSGTPDSAISLRALTEDETLELVASIATLPEELRRSGFPGAFHRSTRGVPLHVLETLALLSEQDLLTHDGGTWSARDDEALLKALDGSGALERRLAALDPEERGALLLLGAAGAPLADDAIEALGAAGGPIRQALARLEKRGLAIRRDAVWEAVHSHIHESLAASATAHELQAALLQAAKAVSESVSTFGAEAGIAAGLMLRAGDRAGLGELFHRLERRARADRDWRHPGVLARSMVGAAGPDDARALVATLPILRRWRLTNPFRAAMAAGIVLGTGATAYVLAAPQPEPAAIVIREQPRTLHTGTRRLNPPLIAEMLDRRGDPVVGFSGDVELGLGSSSNERAWDTITVRASAGRLVLDTLPTDLLRKGERGGALDDTSFAGRVRLRVRTATAAATSGPILHQGGRLRVDSAQLGRHAWRRGETLTASRGENLSGSICVTYDAMVEPASLLGIAVPTWEDRTRSARPLLALSFAVVNDVQCAPITLRAPGNAGRHHLIVVAALETGAEYVASGTNWAYGRPIWFDGNDVVDWTADDIAHAMRYGHVVVTWLYPFVLTKGEVTGRPLGAAGRALMYERRPAFADAILIETR